MIDESRTYELDRAHVFHSWSAQAPIKPLVVARPRARRFWDYDGKRYLDFSSPAGQHQHRPPAPARSSPRSRSRRRRSAPSRRSTPNDARSEAARLIADAGARRPGQGVLHQRRRRRDRERGPDGPAAHRPAQGALAPTAPTTATPHAAINLDRRPASLGQRLRRTGARALLRAVPLPRPRSTRPPRPRSASGRWPTSSRSSRSRDRAPSPRSCSRPSPARPGIMIPPAGYLAGVRELCDRHGIVYIADEVMCRVRPHRPLVRRRPLRRRARPDHLRQGRELRLRAARRRRHLRPDRRDVRRPGLPRRAHLLRPPAGLRRRRRDHRRDAATRASSRTPTALGARGPRPRPARSPSGTRAVGEVRGIGAFWALELVAEPRDPRAAGAVRRVQRGDERRGRRVQEARRAAVRQLQPASTWCRR